MEPKRQVKSAFKYEHWKIIAALLFVYDAVMVNASYFLALLIRYDFRYSWISPSYITVWTRFAPIYGLLCILIFALFGLYRSIWRFASFSEFIKTLAASFLASILHVIISRLY